MQAATTSRRDEKYLRLLRAGNPIPTIARKCKVTPKTVYNGIERARLAEKPATKTIPRPPRVEPIFGCKAWSSKTTCDDIHHGPIKHGSSCCCMVCSRSGMDHHPALRRDPRTDPRPERRSHKRDRLRGGVG